MTTRVAAIAAVLLLAIVVVRRPAPRPPFETSASPFPNPSRSGALGLRSHVRQGSVVPGIVYVAGAVRHPGLYRVAGGERVADEIARAGGLQASADAAAVNLAAHPSDGDEIYVPVEGEAASRAALGSRSSRGAGSVRRRQTRSRAGAAAQIPPQSVDVNRDDAATLALVPGIGPAIAARIVALREREGAFASLDELLDVAGMTQSKLDRARTFLQLP